MTEFDKADTIASCVMGCAALTVIGSVVWLLSSACMYFGSVLVTAAWPAVPQLTWVQSIAAGFVLSFVIAPLMRRGGK